MRGKHRNNVTIVPLHQSATRPVSLSPEIITLATKGQITPHMRKAAVEITSDYLNHRDRYDAAMNRLPSTLGLAVFDLVIARVPLLIYGRDNMGSVNDVKNVSYATGRLKLALKELHEVYNGRKRSGDHGVALNGYSAVEKSNGSR